jgi:hypothetical protein
MLRILTVAGVLVVMDSLSIKPQFSSQIQTMLRILSVSSYGFFVNKAPVCIKSKRQESVMLSVTEA